MFGKAPRTEPIPVRPPQETDGILRAKEAAARSRQGFLDAVDTGTEGRLAAERMHTLRRQNGWGKLIQETMYP